MSNSNSLARHPGATVARRFFDLLARKDIAEWKKLWADDGRIIVFYPPEGFPNEISGRKAIVDGFTSLFETFESFEPTITAIYPIESSDNVCVEYRVQARLRNGAEYCNANIAVFIMDNGLIRAYHDYFDPRRFQVVVNALPKS